MELGGADITRCAWGGRRRRRQCPPPPREIKRHTRHSQSQQYPQARSHRAGLVTATSSVLPSPFSRGPSSSFLPLFLFCLFFVSFCIFPFYLFSYFFLSSTLHVLLFNFPLLTIPEAGRGHSETPRGRWLRSKKSRPGSSSLSATCPLTAVTAWSHYSDTTNLIPGLMCWERKRSRAASLEAWLASHPTAYPPSLLLSSRGGEVTAAPSICTASRARCPTWLFAVMSLSSRCTGRPVQLPCPSWL